MSAMTIPESLPEGFRRIEWAYRRPRWRRMTQIVLLLAEEGVSTASELIRLLGVDKKALHIALDSMLDLLDPLIESQVVSVGSLGRMRVVNLTDYGKALARALGVEPVESDWEKIVRLHNGEMQTRHAALVLLAAYQARLRGWKAEVMPFDPQETPWFQPDLKLTDPEGWFYYAEVETRSRVKPKKWARMRQVNLIVPSPAVRKWMVNRIRDMGIPGRAADLRTLAQQAKAGELTGFWLEKW
jgi:DNA-binding MarR family transcriptional regulator